MRILVAERRNSIFYIDLSVDEKGISADFFEAIHDGAETAHPDDNVYLKGEIPLYSTNISFTTIKSLPDFSDHACFMVYAPVGHMKERMAGMGWMVQPVNLFASTAASKLSGPVYSDYVAGLHPTINIMVPTKDSPVSDWIIGVNIWKKEFLSVITGQEIEVYPGLDVARNLELPKVWFDQKSVEVSPDGVVDLSFYLGNSDGYRVRGDCEVYLEATGGRLNLYRVKTKDGVGSVKVIADHLSTGDTFKVKCGFKHFSGTDDCLVKVV